MSISSLKESMSRKAASMAAVASRARNPNDIQSIQQQLIAGVQNGSIEPYVGIPLIQDLTQKLGEAKAKMTQAMMGEQSPSNEPIAQQVMAQATQGLENLPSNLPQEYAGGGIIAFSPGGSTTLTPEQVDEEIERQSRLANQSQDPSKFSNLRSFVDEYKSLMPEKDPRMAAYEASIMKTPEQLDARRKEDLYMTLAQFGLGLAGSKSPTLAGGISEAGAKVLPSVQTALASRRTAEDAQLRTQADMARADRAEGIAALQGGLGLFGKAEDRLSEEARARLQREASLASSNKPTDMVNYVNTFVRNAQADPNNKKSNDALALEGYQKYFTEGPRLPGQTLAVQQGIAGGQQATQQNIATGTQGVTTAGQGVQANIASLNAFNKALETRGSPEFVENKARKKQDKENAAKGTPTNLAEQYKNTRIEEIAKKLLTDSPPGQPTRTTAPTPQDPPKAAQGSGQPALPPGVPPGSTYGKKTDRGTEVFYQGKLLGHVN